MTNHGRYMIIFYSICRRGSVTRKRSQKKKKKKNDFYTWEKIEKKKGAVVKHRIHNFSFHQGFITEL